MGADNDDSNNNYYEDYDFSDGEGSGGSHGLNDADESLYFDEAAAEKKRKADRARLREEKKQAKPAEGGLEALFSQAPPPRQKSLGPLDGGLPVRRTRATPPLRTRSGGIFKINRKITRTVTDAARTVVDATATVAEAATSVARGRDEEAGGDRVRSNSLGALSRKFSTRADRVLERNKPKHGAEGDNLGGGMTNLSLDDNTAETSPKQGKMRSSSIGALSKRARRGRVKSVDDAEDLLTEEEGEMELDLNDHSPIRERQRGSTGAISTKGRRERCKSVDDAEFLLDAEGEFEMKLEDSPKTAKPKKPKKRSNSVGAIDKNARRGRKKESDKKVKKRSESRGSDDLSSDDDSDHSEKKKVKKVKKKRSKSKSSDTSSDDEDLEPSKPRKKSGKSPKPTKTKKSTRKLSADDNPAEQEALPTRDMGGLDLDGGHARGAGRRMGRRSSLGGHEQHDKVNDILMRSQQSNQRWDASKTEDSVIERRVRRRASIGAEETVLGPGPRRRATRKQSMDL